MKPIEPLIIKTYKAAIDLRNSSDKQIKAALKSIADGLLKDAAILLKANAKDLAKQEPDNPRNDRLMLNEQRIKNIANSIRNISKLPNPAGIILQQRTLPNGLQLQKIKVASGKNTPVLRLNNTRKVSMKNIRLPLTGKQAIQSTGTK